MILRSRALNSSKIPTTDAGCVVYHMSRDQRVSDNCALVEAQKLALTLKLPLVVVFTLFTQPSNRLLQHYQFMISGLEQVEDRLEKLGIGFALLTGNPVEELPSFCTSRRAAALFMDFSPLRDSVTNRMIVAQQLEIPVYEVDSSNVIPLWVTSPKEEYSAKTIRSKIHAKLDEYFVEPLQVEKHHFKWKKTEKINWNKALEQVKAENPAFYKPTTIPGEEAAAKALDEFIKHRLEHYAEERNKPDVDGLSGLSPYFHFGQLSTLRANLELKKAVNKNKKLAAGFDTFFEESIVRRELAQNYCYYNKNYTVLEGAREWAKKTLQQHEKDKREFTYTRQQFEKAQTHDPSWNACQQEMLQTGKMHGYMRMYWAKKILEWSATPQEALDTAVYLNDKYELDGYDANGYTGIMWAICGVHDRPWFERPIYGQIRYMNANGLKRKFKIDSYIEKWLGRQEKIL